MLSRSFSRIAVSSAVSSARLARDGPRACISSMVRGCSSPLSNVLCALRPPAPAGGGAFLPPPANVGRSRRCLSSKKPPVDTGEEGNEVDVTPVGDKPGQITREAIAEAEAAEDLADDDVLGGNPSEWDYDESTEGGDEYNQVSFDDEEDENPPTPILDAYEKSRDPAEMERLIKMSFDSLPERAGPQRYNHKRREHQRYKTIRNIKYKEKAQRAAAHERKLQKRRDRKARELALFATWRGAGAAAAEEDAAIRS